VLNRFSSSALIKAALSALAVLITLLLVARVWDTWRQLNNGAHNLRVVEISDQAFKALVGIRTDRSSTGRDWNDNEPISAEAKAYLQDVQATEMPALRKAVDLLQQTEFTGRDKLLPELQHLTSTLIALQAEFWAGAVKPKADRRAALADEYLETGLALQTSLETVSGQLFADIRHLDGFVDQMMEVKQLAWMVRNTAGEASLLISQGLAAGHLPPDGRQRYDTLVSGANALWSAIEALISGTPLPSRFTDSVAAAKQQFFAADYLATRDRMMNALLTGQKPEMTADQWTPYTVPRLGMMLNVAEAAFDQARAHAQQQLQAARIQLAVELGLLIGAVLLSAASIMAVSRRVIRPLHVLRDAMLRLAEGDLSVEAPYVARRDEIGALARALATFRQQAADKAAIEQAQRSDQQRAATRQQAVDAHIGDFDGKVRAALVALGDASIGMNNASTDMGVIATRSNAQARVAASAAGEASSNVAGIAAATEELSSSIAEISRQVTHATNVAVRAVTEIRQTDGTVRGLTEAAGEIGKVVKLISDIAAQTNLLALNATIEAARAGEAGRGFAVVASEVKSLANQTAKATEEIASQITTIQSVTESAVQAIRQIGSTIDEVSSVATSIAAAIEEQGASTQEIARNTQGTATRTKEVSKVMAEVTEGADATGTTAATVKSAAVALDTAASRLRDEVGEFLDQIRAA
jgi:methyl-accepting chemotaxis protein